MHDKWSDAQLCAQEVLTIASDLDEMLLKILEVEDDVRYDALLILQASCCFCAAIWTTLCWLLLLDARYKVIYCRSQLLGNCITVTEINSFSASMHSVRERLRGRQVGRMDVFT